LSRNLKLLYSNLLKTEAEFSPETLPKKTNRLYSVITQNTINIFNAVNVLTLIESLCPKRALFARKSEKEKEYKGI
jgi:hypothetical protein